MQPKLVSSLSIVLATIMSALPACAAANYESITREACGLLDENKQVQAVDLESKLRQSPKVHGFRMPPCHILNGTNCMIKTLFQKVR